MKLEELLQHLRSDRRVGSVQGWQLSKLADKHINVQRKKDVDTVKSILRSLGYQVFAPTVISDAFGRYSYTALVCRPAAKAKP